MIDNYPEFFAQYVRENAPGVNVYSNIDPARNWNGETIVEIGESEEKESTWFISGNCLIDSKIVVTVRAQTFREAGAFLKGIKRLINRASDLLIENGEIDAWSVESWGETPDIRGIVAGESFYSYYEIKLSERVTDGC